MTHTTAIIETRDLCFSYDTGTPVLKHISLDIRKGEKLVLLGANGSGKSTFFLCLNGIHRPDSGTLTLHGQPYRYTKKHLQQIRQKTGIVFQDPDTQIFSSSVEQEIAFGPLNLGRDPADVRNDISQIMDNLHISALADQPVHFLSGGQKKQVSIADILVMKPEVILLDEPFSSLDPLHTALVQQQIDHMNAHGITVVISTHDLNFARGWADRVCIFKEGFLHAEGSPQSILTDTALLKDAGLIAPDSIKTNKDNKKIMKSRSSKKGILVVSFGTSYPETRKKTIERIEQDITEAYPDHHIYRAFTSGMIIDKLWRRDRLKVHTVTEAMEQIVSDGVTDLVVQPTHIINGIENDLMQEDVLRFDSQMNCIRFGAPLLTTTEDQAALVDAIMQEFPDHRPDEEAIVLMGHGTTHHANAVYAALDYQFKDAGYPEVYVGTVEAYPSLDTLLRQIQSRNLKRVILAPLLIVAGDHAVNDLAGDEEDSWKSVFSQAGFEVSCVLRGLGEYDGVRQIFLQHLNTAVT